MYAKSTHTVKKIFSISLISQNSLIQHNVLASSRLIEQVQLMARGHEVRRLTSTAATRLIMTHLIKSWWFYLIQTDTHLYTYI